jgi:hypothetical protein
MRLRSKFRDRRRGRGSRGATLVESAILTPVFLLFVFGILEFGLIYRDYLSVADASAVGARIGSIVGPGLAAVQISDGTPTGTTTIDGNGDFAAMMAVREDLAAIPIEWIDRIVIFEGKQPSQQVSPLDQVPSVCRTQTPLPSNAPGCNIYEPRDAFEHLEGNVDATDLAYFSCPAPGGSEPACGWDPNDRQNGPTTDVIDYFGVYVKISRPYLTGIFGDDFTIEQAHVLRLEPGALGGAEVG